MEHKGTVPIETNRLLLRQFHLQDSQACFKNWTSDPQVTKYLTWPAHESVAVTEEILEEWIRQYADPSFYQWAIVLKENGDEPMGIISVVDQKEDLNIVHIGYCIGRKWWNQGITSEAFSAIIPFLFQQVKANRIESRHDPNNPNSGNVMKKCGLTCEGTLRQADRNNQGIVDTTIYSILKEEYGNR